MAAKKQRFIHDSLNEPAWFEEGLAFACTGCGRCCSGGTGHVWVTVDEIRSLARAFGLPLDDFGRRYLRRIGQRYSLVEDPSTGDCVFLRGKQCGVYEDRPGQCRAYPWWPEILRSPTSWRQEAERCEGIDPQAPVVTAAKIRESLGAVTGPPRQPGRRPGQVGAKPGVAERRAFESPGDRSKLKS